MVARTGGRGLRGWDAGKHSGDSAGGSALNCACPLLEGSNGDCPLAAGGFARGVGSLSLFWTEIEVTGLLSRVYIQRISLDTAGNRVLPVLSGTLRGTDGRPGARVTRPHSGGRPSHPGTRGRHSQPGSPAARDRRRGPTRHHPGKAVPSPRTSTDPGFTGRRPGLSFEVGHRTRSRPRRVRSDQAVASVSHVARPPER